MIQFWKIFIIIIAMIESIKSIDQQQQQPDDNISNNNDENIITNNHDNKRRYKQTIKYCDHNPLCLCQNYTQQYMDIICYNVQFDTVPDLSRMVSMKKYQFNRNLYRLYINGAKQLTSLNDSDSFVNIHTLTSLSLINTRLSMINGEIFKNLSIKRTLTILDLSYGHLNDLKSTTFDHLEQLQYLSLKGNQIESINVKLFKNLKHLRTLLLNENRLYYIDNNIFKNLTQLQQLNLDTNMIERIDNNPFPLSLRSLSLSNCLLRKIPFNSIEYLKNLQILQLQGNLINHLSPFKLSNNHLQLIDLSHNLIDRIPENLFINFRAFNQESNYFIGNNNNNSIKSKYIIERKYSNMNEPATMSLMNESSYFNFNIDNDDDDDDDNNDEQIQLHIEQFYLDFNFIQSIGSNIFRSIRIDKLSLSNNRLSSDGLSNFDTFTGPMIKTLKVLNINYNLIDRFPRSFQRLKGLKQLLMKNNRIQTIDTFGRSSSTLEVIDLSQNLIEKIPTAAFNKLTNLLKLNLHDNLIRFIDKNDIDGWCRLRLKSLTLSKNNLEYLPPNIFENCRNLNELRLGGNRLLELKPQQQLVQHLNHLQLLDLSSLKSIDWSYNNGNNNSIYYDAYSLQKSFSKLKWLQFDFNQLKTISNAMLSIISEIKHLDLQNNHIESIETDQLNQLKNLQSLILSNNHLKSLKMNTVSNLKFLESITFYYNNIVEIEMHTFNNLPRLQSLILSRNKLKLLPPNIFVNLSSESQSLTLLMDNNQIECLSFDSFENLRKFKVNNIDDDDDDDHDDEQFVLYLNISNNQIKTLENCHHHNEHLLYASINSNNHNNWTKIISKSNNDNDDEPNKKQILSIRVLDLSSNKLNEISRKFLEKFCTKTISFYANNNQIKYLPLQIFINCQQLQTLSLNFNLINDLQSINDYDQLSSIRSSYSVQTLSLQYNQINSLEHFRYLFNHCIELKSLYLNNNQIRSIPANIFSNTSIITLNLSNNQLIFDDDYDEYEIIDHCFGVSSTLKYLDLSFNQIRSISKRIVHCERLSELILSNNQIKMIDHLVVQHLLQQLHRLELDNNPLIINSNQKSFNYLFNSSGHNSPLSTLSLSNINQDLSSSSSTKISISFTNELNLPYLHRFDLSQNDITKLSTRLFANSRNIRKLNLADNKLIEIPKYLWKYITRLQWLSLKNNPIDILDSLSFAGLKYLRYLDIRGLNLQFIDSRIFLYQSQILSLKISTYPQIRSFRLQDILSKCDSLQTIVVDVRESMLSHQIQWAFGGKLQELVITGNNLAVIVPDAFQGLNTANDLIVRITNTSVKHLPDSLLQYLADIRYITIDLRDNQLQTISPSVFFTNINADNYRHSSKTWQSRQLLGGIILKNNPLICDCNLLWLSQWMREVFTEMKSINVEQAINVKSKLSASKCQKPMTCQQQQQQQPTHQHRSISKYHFDKQSNRSNDHNNYYYYNQIMNDTTKLQQHHQQSSSISIIDLRDEDLCHHEHYCHDQFYDKSKSLSSSSSSSSKSYVLISTFESSFTLILIMLIIDLINHSIID